MQSIFVHNKNIFKESYFSFVSLLQSHAEAAEISMKFLASASFADAHYAEVPEWPNGTEEMSKLRSIWRKVS